MSDLVTAVTAWAERREDVRAVILVGSRARVDTPADAWSDTDLVLLVDDPPSYAADPRWLEAFGRPLLTFLEPTAVGGAIERRVLYEDGSDVDFALIPARDALGVVRDERAVEVRAVFARGYRVLVDKMGVSATLPAVTGRPARVALPGQEEFDELANDFWYHAVWTARKLRRGERWTAKDGADGLLHRLLGLLRWHAEAGDPTLDTWHSSRFVERWADPRAASALRTIQTGYDLDELATSILAIVSLFEWVERECADRLRLTATVPIAEVRRLITHALDAPGGWTT